MLMRSTCVVVLAILTLAIIFPSAAQQTSSTAPPNHDAQAMSLLAQCDSAMGTSATAPDVYAVGTIISANPDSIASSVVLKSKGTDRLRTEFAFDSGPQIFVINRGHGFSLIAGKKIKLAGHATSYFRPEHLSAFACSIDLARSNVGVAYVALENLGSITVHHLVFRAASSDPLELLISEFHVYLDPQTFRIVKTANWVFAPDAIQNRSLWETYYDSYQPINGVLVPMHITHFLAGSKLDDWNFVNVRTDMPVAEGDFN
jgi:hypothetical protein